MTPLSLSNKYTSSPNRNTGYDRSKLNGSDHRNQHSEDRKLPDFDINNLNKELFDKIADECAKTIAGGNNKHNKSTQIRRFYDELVMWEERASVSEEAYKNAEPFIYMIKSKVAYAKGRDTIDGTFKNFMYKVIDEISNTKSLKNAKMFMEAVMGFYKSYRPKD